MTCKYELKLENECQTNLLFETKRERMSLEVSFKFLFKGP